MSGNTGTPHLTPARETGRQEIDTFADDFVYQW
jgi:hypothetical protein